jgi:hypothetical protein
MNSDSTISNQGMNMNKIKIGFDEFLLKQELTLIKGDEFFIPNAVNEEGNLEITVIPVSGDQPYSVIAYPKKVENDES